MPSTSQSPSPDTSGTGRVVRKKAAPKKKAVTSGNDHSPDGLSQEPVQPLPTPPALVPSPVSSPELSLRIAEAAARKKAENIVALDLRGISTFTDFYVICSGSSEPQLKAIVDEIEDSLRKDFNFRARRVDGFPYSQWVVADFGDVIVHVFHESKRQHYALEDLWNDAPRLAIPEATVPSAPVQ
jgi:ribosome-associated protein